MMIDEHLSLRYIRRSSGGEKELQTADLPTAAVVADHPPREASVTKRAIMKKTKVSPYDLTAVSHSLQP